MNAEADFVVLIGGPVFGRKFDTQLQDSFCFTGGPSGTSDTTYTRPCM